MQNKKQPEGCSMLDARSSKLEYVCIHGAAVDFLDIDLRVDFGVERGVQHDADLVPFFRHVQRDEVVFVRNTVEGQGLSFPLIP